MPNLKRQGWEYNSKFLNICNCGCGKPLVSNKSKMVNGLWYLSDHIPNEQDQRNWEIRLKKLILNMAFKKQQMARWRLKDGEWELAEGYPIIKSFIKAELERQREELREK